MSAIQLTQIRRMVDRYPIYKRALQEALPESEGYDAFLAKLLDPALSNADVGAAARDIICKYVKEVAAYRGDEL